MTQLTTVPPAQPSESSSHEAPQGQDRPSTGPAAPPSRTRKAKSASALGLTAGEVAALMGISATGFWALRQARHDFPRPVSPLWPGGRGLYDRAAVLAWWRREVKRAQKREESA